MNYSKQPGIPITIFCLGMILGIAYNSLFPIREIKITERNSLTHLEKQYLEQNLNQCLIDKAFLQGQSTN